MKLCKKMQHGPVSSFELGYSPMGPPLMTARCYLVDGLLVDTGLHHSRSALLQALRLQPPQQLVLTHHHEDHSGNAELLRRQFGIPAYAHSLCVERLQQRVKMLPYRHLIWGRAPRPQLQILGTTVETEHHRFKVLSTPGHCRDHVVFIEPEQGWLFSGDLYLGQHIKYFRANEDMTTMIASIKEVLHFDFEQIFCAHRPVFKGGYKALASKLDYLENLRGEVALMLQQGLNERAIFARFKGREQWRVRVLTFGDASMKHMLRAAIVAARLQDDL